MKAGGVACVERLRNPIQAARLVLEESPHVYFVGEGAEAFAAGHGMELIENAELVLPRERDRLKAAQARAAAGMADETFSGLQDDKEPHTAVVVLTEGEAKELGIKEQGTELRPRGSVHDPTGWSHDTVGAVALDRRGRQPAEP
jgi:beta-aspartyl-peptidase (threonine type)